MTHWRIVCLFRHLLDITRSGNAGAQTVEDPATRAAAAKVAAARLEASFSEAAGEINPEKEPEKPSTDLFKAIFEESSESEEDEDEDEETSEEEEQ